MNANVFQETFQAGISWIHELSLVHAVHYTSNGRPMCSRHTTRAPIHKSVLVLVVEVFVVSCQLNVFCVQMVAK